MRTRHASPALAATLLLFAAACASNEPPVSSAFDPLVQFPAQATYVWDPEANVLPDNPSIRQSSLAESIRNLADEAMAARGYTEAVTGTPPYRLSYQVTVHSWIGAEQSSSTASLALRLADFASNRTVWLGFTRIEVDLSRTIAERTALLRDTFERMLATFPPSQPGA